MALEEDYLPDFIIQFKFDNSEIYSINSFMIVHQYADMYTRMKYIKMLEEDDPLGNVDEVCRILAGNDPSNESWEELFQEGLAEITSSTSLLGVYARTLPWSFVKQCATLVSSPSDYNYEDAWTGIGGSYVKLERLY